MVFTIPKTVLMGRLGLPEFTFQVRVANKFLDKFKATRDPDHVAEWTKRRRL